MGMVTTTIMAEEAVVQALLRLVTWLSPAFPVGAYSYSGGLEQAVHDGLVTNADDLRLWLDTLMNHGPLWNDALLLAESFRGHADPARLQAVAELAEALAGSRERHMETMLLGEAFLAAAGHWPHPVLETLGPTAAYPVAVGAVAGAHRTGLEPTLAGLSQRDGVKCRIGGHPLRRHRPARRRRRARRSGGGNCGGCLPCRARLAGRSWLSGHHRRHCISET
ncbi:hypothetical protein ABIA25_000633 [Sinorhizobium fredii]